MRLLLLLIFSYPIFSEDHLQLNSHFFKKQKTFLLQKNKQQYGLGFLINSPISKKYDKKYHFILGTNVFLPKKFQIKATALFQIIKPNYFYNFGIHQNKLFTSLGFKTEEEQIVIFNELNQKTRQFGLSFFKGKKVKFAISFLKSNKKENTGLTVGFQIPFDKFSGSISYKNRKNSISFSTSIFEKEQTEKVTTPKQKFRKKKKRSSIKVIEIEELLHLGFPIKKAFYIHKYSKNAKKYYQFIKKLSKYEKFQLIQLQKKRNTKK